MPLPEHAHEADADSDAPIDLNQSPAVDDVADPAPPQVLRRSSSSSSSSSTSRSVSPLRIVDHDEEEESLASNAHVPDDLIDPLDLDHASRWQRSAERIGRELIVGGNYRDPSAVMTEEFREAVTSMFHEFATVDNPFAPSSPYRTMSHSDMRRFIYSCGAGESSATTRRLDALFRKYLPPNDVNWTQYEQMTHEGFMEFYRQACFDRIHNVWSDLRCHNHFMHVSVEDAAELDAVAAEQIVRADDSAAGIEARATAALQRAQEAELEDGPPPAA